MRRLAWLCFLFCFMPLAASSRASAPLGYYRFPSLHHNTLVFSAEGDLWRVGAEGGTASRLTSHPREELFPALAPDGETVAFSASYEGPLEVYTMPIDGGLPKRLTWSGTSSRVVGWTPDGQILYATSKNSTLPATQLFRLDPKTGRRTALPLAQASDGSYSADGHTLFFTRFDFQGSHTKRYRGGTAQNIWRFSPGDKEAVPLTAGYAGTSRSPIYWNGRVYFVSDRDGTMNLWSMDPNGGGLRQLTRHSGWDVASPALSEGRIVYQLGADLWIYDVATKTDRRIDIHLASDFDQTRELWIKNPMGYVTATSLSPKGDKVVLTARGQVFVAPVKKKGRLVEVTRKSGVRYRNARFMPDGKTVLALSDESGEVELWTLPANGVGKPAQLTNDGKILRWEGVPSPDGTRIAHHDKNQTLWLYDVATKEDRKIDSSDYGGFNDLRWSPDGRWLAYTTSGANTLSRIYLYDTRKAGKTPLTTDRYDSYSPAWTPDGNWIYFLSDRTFRTLVGSPWGPRQPDPFVPDQTKIYAISLKKEFRSPFQPPDELLEEKPPEKKDENPTKTESPASTKDGDPKDADSREDKNKKVDSRGAEAGKDGKAGPVEIDLEGIMGRLIEAPIPAGNYRGLSTDGKRLFWLASPAVFDGKTDLKAVTIDPEKADVKTVLADVRGDELSADGKKLLVRKGDDLFVFDAGESAPSNLGDSKVDLSGWSLSVDPPEQWRQMFDEAWRLHRDYFYDPAMHQVDWRAMRAKYRPLVDRVTIRGELSDLIAQMVAELSALHTFVYGGDSRDAPDNVEIASLGAELDRDETQGGYRVVRIYRSDPDDPNSSSPLSRPGVRVAEGDVIEAIDGADVLAAPDPGQLLRNQAGKQVLLRVKAGAASKSRDVVVTPISQGQERSLRYGDWELSRRKRVEEEGGGRIGYIHLQGLVGPTYGEWVRDFYPVFDRQGLILDLRHNGGGNTDSWIIGKLLRKAWFYWKDRVGEPYWNMQYAFRGQLVVLVNENTASDGEALTEGIKRLGLGKVIGTRTWGGEIWLSSDNVLVDGGVATAAESGVYGPEGQWLIEGRGVEPDIVVDNLPHATYLGEDAQLEAALRYLDEEIRKNPIPAPKAPAYPNKAFRYPERPLQPMPDKP